MERSKMTIPVIDTDTQNRQMARLGYAEPRAAGPKASQKTPKLKMPRMGMRGMKRGR